MTKVMLFLVFAALPLHARALALSVGAAGYSESADVGIMIEVGHVFSTQSAGDIELVWGRYTLSSGYIEASRSDTNFFYDYSYASAAELRDIHVVSLNKKSDFNVGKHRFSLSYGPAVAHYTSYSQSTPAYALRLGGHIPMQTYVEKGFDFGIHSNLEALLWESTKGSLSWQLPWIREMMINEEFIFSTGIKYAR